MCVDGVDDLTCRVASIKSRAAAKNWRLASASSAVEFQSGWASATSAIERLRYYGAWGVVVGELGILG